MEQFNVTRRGFLAGMIGTAAVAGLGLQACSPGLSNTGSEGETDQVVHNVTATEECDIVVVGSGTAGTCATLKAAERGANVICIERQATLGGSSVMTRGLCGINTRFQASNDIVLDQDEMFRETLQYHHYACSGEVVRTFIDECGATVDWYEDNGIAFATCMGMGGSRPVWHIPLGEDGKPSNTKYMLSVLQPAAEAQGAEFRTDCTMTGLVVEDGCVKGIYAETGDGEIELRAKAVILATGGYSDSAEAFERLTDTNFDTVKAWGMGGRNGDGILKAVDEAAAALHHAGTVMYHTGTVASADKFNAEINFATLWQPTVRVNEQARRFFDESMVNDFSACGNALTAQQASFVIFDDAYIDSMESNGPVYGAPALGINEGEPYECRAAIEGCEDFVKAATIKELGEALGLNGDSLEQTVAEYNDMVAAGVDSLFGRKDGLMPIATAPFYGAKVTPTYFTTVGGLKVTRDMQVEAEDGTLIEGLYAAGCDAGGLYGADYDVSVASGSQQGWCATSGRLAAEAAVAML